jgi:lysophospholipase L1-like esterase
MTGFPPREPGSGSKPLGPGRRAVYGVVALVLAAFVTIVIGELGVRIAAPQPASWLDVYRRHPTLPFYTLAPHVERLIDTGETRWTVFTDEHGYRVSERAAKAPRPTDNARPVALVLGDSFTFAQSVDYEDSFAALLEADGPLRYVNTGVPGYGPVQYRQVLEYELQSRREPPKLLLVATFLGNDFQDCIRNRDLPVHDGVVSDQGNLKSAIKRRSHLYRLVARAYHLAVARHDESAEVILETFDPEQWNAGGGLHQAVAIYERELARMAAIAKQRAIPMIVIIIPARAGVEALQGRPIAKHLDYDLPARFVRTRLDALQVPFVDLAPLFARHPVDKVFFGHDLHFTPYGHRLVADAVRPLVDRIAGSRTNP